MPRNPLNHKRGRPRKGRWRTPTEQHIWWASHKSLHKQAVGEIRRRLERRLLAGLFGDGDAGCSIITARELHNPSFRFRGHWESLRCP